MLLHWIWLSQCPRLNHAGAMALLAHFGDPEGLYLAGGFGTYIDPASAMAIGMLPPVLAGKVRPLGNTALAGAAALALDSRLWPKVEDTARSCAYIELSGQPDFTQAFTGNMGF